MFPQFQMQVMAQTRLTDMAFEANVHTEDVYPVVSLVVTI